MQELKEKKCIPCEPGTKPLTKHQIENYLQMLHLGWYVSDNKSLSKSFPFENYKRGVAFAQDVALIAEREQHHPEICIFYNNVEIKLSTQSIDGLSENDFIMAAKIEEL